jgi:hypothetical protein
MLSPLHFTASRTLVRKIGGERLERNNVFGHLLLRKLQIAWLKQLYVVKPRVPLLCGAWRVACRRGLNRESSKWPEKSGLFVLLLISVKGRGHSIFRTKRHPSCTRRIPCYRPARSPSIGPTFTIVFTGVPFRLPRMYTREPKLPTRLYGPLFSVNA